MPRERSNRSRPPRTDHKVDNQASLNGNRNGITLSVSGTDQPARGNVESRANGDDSDGEICFICASRVIHTSVAPCNHRTCHICALRLRALYKTKACAHCRTVWDHVVFSDDASKNFEDFKYADFVTVDKELGIRYESHDILQDTVLLLRFNCPDPSCDVACLGWPDLHRHVKTIHHKIMCALCTNNKKVFTHEHELFTYGELRKHERFGDDHPGAEDQSGFRGHPDCGFCKQRFYGDDELYAHCRERHERCHICDRRDQGRRQQYYVDYDSLEQHFRQEHFLCPDTECLEKKFVVFESEIDLKAHQLEAHPNGLSKDARREARRVDMSGFDYRLPRPSGGRGERRENRGREGGRGRDPNAEPLPPSSAQPLGRAELAFQRQLAVQSAQSISTRTFGGQLTAHAAAARPSSNGRDGGQRVAEPGPRPHSSGPGEPPSIGSLGLNPTSTEQPSPTDEEEATPHQQARKARHAAVMGRALTLLTNDQVGFEDFRSKVSSFQRSTMSAAELVDSLYIIFDASVPDLGKLIKELAEIYENPSKRTSLLQAWNDWKATREDYPALPDSSAAAATPTSALGRGGARVLRLKNSTAQSSRSEVSRHGSWGSGPANPTAPPPVTSASSVSAQRSGSTVAGAAPWGGSSTPSQRPAAPTSTPKPPARARSAFAPSEAFPALPAAARPATSIALLGYGRGPVRRDLARAPATNAWAGVSASDGTNPGGSAADSAAHSAADDGDNSKKKGKGPKRQVLFHFG